MAPICSVPRGELERSLTARSDSSFRFKKPIGVDDESFAGSGQFNRLADAIEEFLAVFLFQLANLSAHRGLGAKEFLAGA